MKSIHHNYPDTEQSLPSMASWPATMHQFEAEHILALRAAEATGRPLLVRGEAGTGKSQLAHAAAFLSQRAFLPVVVGAHTEATDLHWKFDAIARLADAHMAANLVGTSTPQTSLHVQHYVQPGALWWALNWQSACAQQQQCRHGGATQPHTPAGWTPEQGVVLLIDEIDKGEPDLPNGMLEALANGAFEVPLLGLTVQQSENCPPPLIIITTNDERELPAAFLRRCLVMTLALPTGDAALREWLIKRGKLHFPALPEESLILAANMMVEDRKAAQAARCYAPGLAEYLDLLRALDEFGDEALELLPKLKQFYFVKQPGAAEAY